MHAGGSAAAPRLSARIFPSQDKRPTLRQIGTRSYVFNNFSASVLTANSQSYSYNRSGVTAASMVIGYGNFSVSTSASNGGPKDDTEVANAAKTIYAGIEYPVGSGNWTRVLWSGVSQKALQAGELAISDPTPLTVPIPNGGKFAVRFYIVMSSAGSLGYTNNTGTGTGTNTLRMSGEGVESSTGTLPDKSLGGTITPGTGGLITPIAILGRSNVRAGYLTGDSIMQGYGDSATDATNAPPFGDTGIVARSVGPVFPYINTGVPSERAWKWVSNNSRRLALLRYCQFAISNFGVNDYDRDGRSAAQVEAALTSVAASFPNMRRYQTTITPVTGSANAAARVTVNNWLRAGGGGFTGFFEVADVFDARDSGVWFTSPQAQTGDGTHPNPYGYSRVPASPAINPLGL